MAGTLAASPHALVAPPLDEAAARRTLREQIARLELELGRTLCLSYPRIPPPARPRRLAGPRILGIAELELIRDDLVRRLGDVDRQTDARQVLERMLLAPTRYQGVRITSEDLGEPSCKAWESRPRLGPLGRLMGWWRVKISSGCPLPGP
jgi:hypothetical protein